MTTWILLPSHGGAIRILNADNINEFMIIGDSQKIFTLMASFGGGENPERIQLMKTNNEPSIKEALNQFFNLNARSRGNNSDIIVEFGNDRLMQQPTLY